MSAIQNENLHYINKWKLGIHTLPAVQFNCYQVEFPSVTSQPISLSTPVGKHFVSGKSLDYGQFTFSFHVDEDFENYYSVFEWMIGSTGSITMENYKLLTSNDKKNIIGVRGHNIFSDGTLFVLKNSMQTNIEFNIVNMFPIGLGSPQFVMDGNVTKNVCSATFQVDYFELNRKKS
jgi:hypothetical protein